MRVLYDTTTVHPLDRYDHYRVGAASELAPVDVHGRAPGRLFARMSACRIGEFDLEELTWAADAEIVTRRTERLIRVGDCDRYRLVLAVTGEVHLEQAGNRVRLHPGDIGLYHLSEPWRAAHPPEVSRIRVVMLTFPGGMLTVHERAIRALAGTLVPRRLPGRDLTAQLLVALAGAVEPDDFGEVLPECASGLIRRWLGLPGGVAPGTGRMLYLARIRDIIRTHLADPELDPERIAKAAAISPRYLHRLFEGTGMTPMQFLKRVRLDEGHRRLADPSARTVRVREIAAACGYRRTDQFARDFRQAFGIAPSEVR